jgi:hypothetical protein
MALNSASAKWLYDIVRKNNITGNALALGVQDILFSKENLIDDHGIEFPFDDLNLQTLFQWLGFDSVDTLDVSDYEGANLIVDLNEDMGLSGLPRYSFILDFGTMEHVFNVPNGLKNVFNMLKHDGYAFHLLPASNGVQHGFYQFSPTMLVDYYRANNFSIKMSHIAKTVEYSNRSGYELFPYYSWNEFNPPLGGMDNSIYYSTILVKKLDISTCYINPSQSAYKDRLWLRKNHQVEKLKAEFAQISEISQNIYIYGYSEYAEALSKLLRDSGYKVLGFIDTFRYGFDSSLGRVLSPNDEALVCQKANIAHTILFATKNAKGGSSNKMAFGSLCNICEQDGKLLPQCFSDTDLEQHDVLSESYLEIATLFRKKIKSARRDKVLKVPSEYVYMGMINTLQ